MKKLLIIALLFWGCDYAPTEHSHVGDGVCVKRYAGPLGTNYSCYEDATDWNEKDCLAKELNSQNNEYNTYEWYTMSCDEFCAIESSYECYINSDDWDN